MTKPLLREEVRRVNFSVGPVYRRRPDEDPYWVCPLYLTVRFSDRVVTKYRGTPVGGKPNNYFVSDCRGMTRILAVQQAAALGSVLVTFMERAFAEGGVLGEVQCLLETFCDHVVTIDKPATT